MAKVIKIFEDEKEKYSVDCYVNTVIFRCKIPQTPKLYRNDTVKFSVQLSGEKDEKQNNGEIQRIQILWLLEI